MLFGSSLKKIIENIRDIVFPIECLGCNFEGLWICKSCLRQIKLNNTQVCIFCKKENKGEVCKECKQNYFVDGCVSFGLYSNKLLSKIIRALKYNLAKELAEILANFLFILWKNELSKSYISDNYSGNEFINTEWLVIPVPLHKRRERWRGFNQSELLAKAFAARTNLVTDVINLKRINQSKAQAKSKSVKRQQNIKNAFSWQGVNLKGRAVLLIDDVVTTGATINECARVLKQNGATRVYGLTIARG